MLGFILYKHSLLGVFCAGDDSVPIMKSTKVCPCCVSGKALDQRHRVMILLLVIVLTVVAISQSSYYYPEDFGTAYVLMLGFVVTPLAALFSSWIRNSSPISADLRPSCLSNDPESIWVRPISWVELLIVLVCCYTGYNAYTVSGAIGMEYALYALVAQWVAVEPASLAFQYFCCSCCCPCCVPDVIEEEGAANENVDEV